MTSPRSIEDYLEFLSSWADQVTTNGVRDLLPRLIKDPNFATILTVRQDNMTTADKDRATPLLTTDLYTGHPTEERLACITLALELEQEAASRHRRKRFALYKSAQPLFVGIPSLLGQLRSAPKKKPDLINARALTQQGTSEVARCGSRFALLEPLLHPTVLSWTTRHHPGRPTYVRLDPTQAFTTPPPQRLCESIQVPATPGWARTLTLHPRPFTGAVYRLDPPASPEINIDDYWTYRVRGIRKLDTGARRRGQNLSFLIEEIAVDPATEGGLIGRTLHLDTGAPPGTDSATATLNHLDLAINVYDKSAAAKRRNEDLRHGKVTDATYRTHLLRIEGVSLSCLFDYATMFLVSASLRREWLHHEFGQGPKLTSRIAATRDTRARDKSRRAGS